MTKARKKIIEGRKAVLTAEKQINIKIPIENIAYFVIMKDGLDWEIIRNKSIKSIRSEIKCAVTTRVWT